MLGVHYLLFLIFALQSAWAPASAQPPSDAAINSPRLPYQTPESMSRSAGSGADDTGTFAAIFAQGYNVKLSPGKTYRLNGLVLNGNVIECSGLGGHQQGAPGVSKIITGNAKGTPAGPAVIFKGWGSQARNCAFGDPNNYSLVQTTLTENATANATSITVRDPRNFTIGRLAFITLDSGLIWPVKIGSKSDSILTFVSGDKLPSAASVGQFVQTATAVVRFDASSGPLFPNDSIFNYLEGSVFNGQPMAIEIVNTDPDPAANVAFNQQSVISNVFTYYTSLLPLWLDANVTNYQFMNVQLWGRDQSTTTLSAAAAVGARSVMLSSIAGVTDSISVTLDSGRVWPVSGKITSGKTFMFSSESTLPSNAAAGNTVITSSAASANYLQDGRGSTVTYGGHNGFNLLGIQSMNGFIFRGANLSSFVNLISDVPNAVLIEQRSQWLTFNNVFTAAQMSNGATGVPTPAGSYGFKVTDSSVQIQLVGLQSFGGGGGKSLWIDRGSIVHFDPSTWSGNRSFGGSGDYIGGAHPMFQVNLTTAQPLPDAAVHKVLFDGVAVDTGRYWDAENHRFKPRVAGWYEFSLNVQYIATVPGVGASGNYAYIAKNGSQGPTMGHRYSANNISISVPSTKMYLNGSTDYVEAFVSFGGKEASVAGGAGPPFLASWFEGKYIGP